MVQGRHVLVIDLLRVVAAFIVVLYHLVAIAPALDESCFTWFVPLRHLPAGGAWAAPGWVGVEIFFVISGYVIARSARAASAPLFLARRALRLAPAAWLCGSLTAALLLAWSTVPTPDVLARWSSAMLFLPRLQTIDPSYWTLELEVVFYLLVAAALRLGGARVAERAIIVLGLASAAFLLAAAARHAAPTELDNVRLRLTLLPHGVFFALGALLAAAHSRGVSARGVALGAVFAAAALAEIALHTARVAVYVPGAPGSWAPALGFGAVVTAIFWAQRSQAAIAAWMSTGLLATLSAATYPLYLLHQVVGSALIALGMAWGLPAGAATALAIGAVTVLAIAVSAWPEPTLRRCLDAVLRGRIAALRDGVAASRAQSPRANAAAF